MDKVFTKEVNRLIFGIARGKPLIGELYGLVGGRLFLVVRNYLYHTSDAEDALQDVFITVAEKASSLKDFDNCYGWLVTVARNTSFNYNRRIKNGYNATEKLSGMLEFSYINEDALAVSMAVKELDEEARQLIYYKYWEGRTLKEIGELTNTPLSTVKYRLKLAEDIIKGKLSYESK